MPQIAAAWIQRFARQLITQRPQLPPLAAVREAISAHEASAHLSPEQAADAFARCGTAAGATVVELQRGGGTRRTG